MRPRIALGTFLIRLGRFIESLAPAVMRPDDLVAFSRKIYSRPENVALCGSEEFIGGGLSPLELELLQHVPLNQGRLLLLGMGGGRDALALARMGFDVVGVDYVADSVEKAKANAAHQGLKIEGLVQEISRLEVPNLAFDLVVFSAGMYSVVPNRQRRVEMLQRIGRSLKPGGYVVLQFVFDPGVSRRFNLVRKAVAFLTWGNLQYEVGDCIAGTEFVHNFFSWEDLEAEFAAGGFTVAYLADLPRFGYGGAVLRSRP